MKAMVHILQRLKSQNRVYRVDRRVYAVKQM